MQTIRILLWLALRHMAKYSLDGRGVEHDMHGLTGLNVAQEVFIHSNTNDLRHEKTFG